MSAETELNAALLAASAVTSIVGAGNAARVFPELVPLDNARPAIAYSRTGTEYTTTIHSMTPVGEETTLDIWCMAGTKVAADALADVVIPAIGAAGFRIVARASVMPDPERDLIATSLTVVKYRNI